jgi:hypothetical protein
MNEIPVEALIERPTEALERVLPRLRDDEQPLVEHYDTTLSAELHKIDHRFPPRKGDDRKRTLAYAIEEEVKAIRDFLEEADRYYRLAALQRLASGALESQNQSDHENAEKLLKDLEVSARRSKANRKRLLKDAHPHLERIAFLRMLEGRLEPGPGAT